MNKFAVGEIKLPQYKFLVTFHWNVWNLGVSCLYLPFHTHAVQKYMKYPFSYILYVTCRYIVVVVHV